MELGNGSFYHLKLFTARIKNIWSFFFVREITECTKLDRTEEIPPLKVRTKYPLTIYNEGKPLLESYHLASHLDGHWDTWGAQGPEESELQVILDYTARSSLLKNKKNRKQTNKQKTQHMCSTQL